MGNMSVVIEIGRGRLSCSIEVKGNNHQSYDLKNILMLFESNIHNFDIITVFGWTLALLIF